MPAPSRPTTEDQLLDLVDQHGNVVGHAPRSRCHGDPTLLHRAVHLLVFNDDGQLFLQRRGRHKRIQPGRWDSSVGGHVDLGETPEQALRREAEEELGLTDFEAELLHRYLWRSEVESELITSYRTVHRGPFQLAADEIDEGRFFSARQLQDLAGTGELTPNLEHELRLLGLIRQD